MDTNVPSLPGLHHPNPNRPTQTDRHSVKITHNVNVTGTEPKSLGLVRLRKTSPTQPELLFLQLASLTSLAGVTWGYSS